MEKTETKMGGQHEERFCRSWREWRMRVRDEGGADGSETGSVLEE